MKLTIDSQKKTIEIDAPFKIKELVEHLNEFLVNWEDYSIIPKQTNNFELPFRDSSRKPKVDEITKPWKNPFWWGEETNPYTIRFNLIPNDFPYYINNPSC